MTTRSLSRRTDQRSSRPDPLYRELRGITLLALGRTVHPRDLVFVLVLITQGIKRRHLHRIPLWKSLEWSKSDVLLLYIQLYHYSFVKCSSRIDDFGSKVILPSEWTSYDTPEKQANIPVPPLLILNFQVLLSLLPSNLTHLSSPPRFPPLGSRVPRGSPSSRLRSMTDQGSRWSCTADSPR